LLGFSRGIANFEIRSIKMGVHYTEGKLSEEIFRKMTHIILYKLKTNFNSKMVTVTQVALSRDNKTAKVYISVLEGRETGQEVVRKLNSLRRIINRMLLKSMYIKKLPIFTFVYDDSIEKSIRVNRMLDELLPPMEE
jgi:ribosome-binding factor A